jgi:thermitase
MLYSVSFFTALVLLAIWFYNKENENVTKFIPALLGLSLLTYLASVAITSADISDKLVAAFRDFMVLGGTGLLFRVFAKTKIRFLPVLLITILLYMWYNGKVMSHSFDSKADKLEMEAVTDQTESTSDIIEAELASEAELLIEITENETPASLQAILDKYDLTLKRAFTPEDGAITELDDYFTVDIPDNALDKIAEIENDLNQSGFIDWVEANEVININPLPSKKLPAINKKFRLNDPDIEQLWAFEAMEMDKLYNYLEKNKVKASKKALVAILDTGVDAEHEDLKGNYKSIEKQYDNDPQSHGTHCAGIAGAVSNNGKGGASYSRDNSYYQISSIKVLNSSGMGTQQSIINGILKAADKGADVISLSLGGPSNQSRQRAYKKAVAYANKKGAIVVVAAGNSNRNAKNYSPANAPGVIAVSAVDNRLNRAVFSNYISDIEMGIAAPGVQIYSTIPSNKYASFNGTSMATPYVAGLLGLMKSIKPKLTTKDAFELLKNNGKNTRDTKFTGQFIQPGNAVKALVER